MLRHLVCLFLVCALVAGVLRPAIAVDHADMAPKSSPQMVHDMETCESIHASSPLSEAKKNTPATPNKSPFAGCAAMASGCFPPAVATIHPFELAELSVAPWVPWMAPAENLIAIMTAPEIRPPRLLS